MSGHGHVIPNPSGLKARCGGPGLCPECAAELKELEASRPTEDELVERGMEVVNAVLIRELYAERARLEAALRQVVWLADATEPSSVKAAEVARAALASVGKTVGETAHGQG